MALNLSAVYVNILNLFTERMESFPYNVQASLYLILFCIATCCLLYCYIGLRRVRQWFENKRDKRFKEKITSMLANIVVNDDEIAADEIVGHFVSKFKKLPLKRKAVRDLLVKEILHYHSNFTGSTAVILRGLYLGLKLNHQARKKLQGRWETQIEGIREITQMNLREETDTILELTGNENSQVRMEAQIAFVKLSTDNPFRFLESASEQILDWHQLVLFEVITKTENTGIPSFSQWLASKNPTVVMLCLKLIDHYQQLDAIPELIRLLEHDDLQIRRKGIAVLGNLEAENAELSLCRMYAGQPIEVKLEIIRAMGKIASTNYLEFLSDEMSSKEFKIRMEAVHAIKRHGFAGTELLMSVSDDSDVQNQLIIKHVLDERIVI